VFVAIDFDNESLPARLSEIGFRENVRTLFILEGVADVSATEIGG
jgi:O-methyltransferase involved in polyketide biosynthesis